MNTNEYFIHELIRENLQRVFGGGLEETSIKVEQNWAMARHKSYLVEYKVKPDLDKAILMKSMLEIRDSPMAEQYKLYFAPDLELLYHTWDLGAAARSNFNLAAIVSECDEHDILAAANALAKYYIRAALIESKLLGPIAPNRIIILLEQRN